MIRITNPRFQAIMILFISASPLGSLIRLFMLVLEYLYENKESLDEAIHNLNNNNDHHQHSSESSADDNDIENDSTNNVDIVDHHSNITSVIKYMYDLLIPFFIPNHQHLIGMRQQQQIPTTGLASLFYDTNRLQQQQQQQQRHFTPDDILRSVFHHHAIPIGSLSLGRNAANVASQLASSTSSSTVTTAASTPSALSSSSQSIMIEKFNQDIEMVLLWIFAFTALIIIPLGMIVLNALWRRSEMEKEQRNNKIELYRLCLEDYCKVLTEDDIVDCDDEDDGDGATDAEDDDCSGSSFLEKSVIVIDDDDDEDENKLDNEVENDTAVDAIDDSQRLSDTTTSSSEIRIYNDNPNTKADHKFEQNTNNENVIIINDDSDVEDDQQERTNHSTTRLTGQSIPNNKKLIVNHQQYNLLNTEFEDEDNITIYIPKSGNSLQETIQRQNDPNNKDEQLRQVSGTCAICLSSYDVGDKIVWSSFVQCPHVFHHNCVTTWIEKRGNSSCPCCRRDFIDTGLCRKLKRGSRKHHGRFD